MRGQPLIEGDVVLSTKRGSAGGGARREGLEEAMRRLWGFGIENAMAAAQLSFELTSAAFSAFLLVPELGRNRITVKKVTPTSLVVELVGEEKAVDTGHLESALSADEIRLLEVLATDRDRHLLTPDAREEARATVVAMMSRTRAKVERDWGRRKAI